MPKTSGVPRGEAPGRAGGAKPQTRARGSGGSPGGQTRPPAPAAKTKPAPAAKAPPPAPTPTLTEPVDPATLHLTAAPVLHRILTCHVPVGAITRLESTGDSLFTAARNALQSGIRALEHDLTHDAAATRPSSGEEHAHTRPIAVPAGLAAALLVTRLAEECFHGDVHIAGGWLVARGAGHPVTLPTPGGAATRQALLGAIHRLAASERAGKPGKSGRSGRSTSKAGATKSSAQAAATVASGARVSAPLILVPAGPQLRAMREALGVTREEVAQVAGLTPDTVGEIERDRRPTAAARLQVAEVLCGMNPATRLAA
ncbi:MAG TPA: helix-turn-helix transcriptional regulator [Chloroflexota bacterium]|nr:helix-turn-helix transcriptional regulator [Chloroflexota bacterium]